ncbi:ras-related protein Rab-38 [Crotalus tigris]|uniref:ras-related protein Rab-38 n=1 Tax=Crotalus tigris TaxID=88082 RepID=UPI00192F1B8A|nr:ras-related protein Rab-38 [Crotalus tigris]
MRKQPPGQQEHLYKLLVIGDLGVGKTSIIKRYVHHNFSPHYRATIGVDFALKVLSWDSETVVRLQLWDIAGQERFGNMTRVYYREAVGAFIVFDVTRPATFEAVTKWKEDLDTKLTLPNGQMVPTVLLANKCDQAQELLVNNGFKMDQFCKDNGFVGWFETSAKDNINIDEAARCLVKHIISSDSEPAQPMNSDVINPHLNSSKSNRCSACFGT